MGLIDFYTSVLNLFIGFNIGFILILLGSILFLLIIYLKLVYLKKEFQSYKLKILNNIENTEMFKLIVNNCPNAFYKNGHYQKLLNKVKSVTGNKEELQDDDLWNFLTKNFNIWDAFCRYLYCCKNELNLNFKFKESSFFTPRNFNTFISFSHSVSKKDLYGKEVYEIFTSYLNSFEIIKMENGYEHESK